MNHIFHNITRLALITLAAISAVPAAHAISATAMGSDYQITRISGNSMLPTLNSGEVAVVFKAYPFSKLRIGDVVIIESERGYNVIHRIVRRHRGGTWVTQGDNNRNEDREVLNSKNFGGLALVDESMVRYQNYLASIGGANINDQAAVKVAMADTSSAGRLERLRKL
jgi:signal peptidase I